ncbi:MAG: hypothetical protein AAF901_04765 [Bacteroidota bacterium]
MKQHLLLVLLLSLMVSCDEDLVITGPSNIPDTILVLNEQVVINQTLDAQSTHIYNSNVQPQKTDFTIFGNTQEDSEQIEYNSDGTRRRVTVFDGLEFITYDYTYINGFVIGIEKTVSGPGGTDYAFNYNGDTLEIISTISIGSGQTASSKLVYIFNTANQLLELQHIFDNDNAPDDINIKYEYEYDGNSNLIRQTRFNQNPSNPALFVTAWIKEYTYDDNVNPFWSLDVISPVVVLDEMIISGSGISIFDNTNFARNNMLTSTQVSPDSDITEDVNIEYEYNEFGYPTSAREIYTTVNTATGEENEFRVLDKTFIYY